MGKYEVFPIHLWGGYKRKENNKEMNTLELHQKYSILLVNFS